jgi:hypothetical protein
MRWYGFVPGAIGFGPKNLLQCCDEMEVEVNGSFSPAHCCQETF